MAKNSLKFFECHVWEWKMIKWKCLLCGCEWDNDEVVKHPGLKEVICCDTTCRGLCVPVKKLDWTEYGWRILGILL